MLDSFNYVSPDSFRRLHLYHAFRTFQLIIGHSTVRQVKAVAVGYAEMVVFDA